MKWGRLLLQMYHADFGALDGPVRLEACKVLSEHSWLGFLHGRLHLQLATSPRRVLPLAGKLGTVGRWESFAGLGQGCVTLSGYGCSFSPFSLLTDSSPSSSSTPVSGCSSPNDSLPAEHGALPTASSMAHEVSSSALLSHCHPRFKIS